MSSDRKVKKTRFCLSCKRELPEVTAADLKTHFKACAKPGAQAK